MEAVTTQIQKSYEADWACQDCGYNNFADRMRCRQCGNQSKNADILKKTETSKKTRPGDWMCVCGVHNFSYRQECYGCSRPLAQNNRMIGDWKKGDWFCSSCSYHNYSKNTTCRKCSEARD